MKRIRPVVWHALIAAVVTGAALSIWLQVPWHEVGDLAGAGPKLAEYLPPTLPEPQETARLLLVTVAMGFWGTVLATILAIPLSCLAARNATPSPILYGPARFILNLVRSLPDPIMVLLFLSCLPIGPLPGVLALGIHSAGFLGKAAAESIERTPKGISEGLISVGATPLQVARFGTYPSIGPELIAFIAYTLYRNTLMAVTLGIVGAGGIGTPLNTALRHFEKTTAAGYIIVIAAVVVAFDVVAGHIRERTR